MQSPSVKPVQINSQEPNHHQRYQQILQITKVTSLSRNPCSFQRRRTGRIARFPLWRRDLLEQVGQLSRQVGLGSQIRVRRFRYGQLMGRHLQKMLVEYQRALLELLLRRRSRLPSLLDFFRFARLQIVPGEIVGVPLVLELRVALLDLRIRLFRKLSQLFQAKRKRIPDLQSLINEVK